MEEKNTISYIRRHYGLTQSQLANIMGVAREKISEIENKNINLQVKAKIDRIKFAVGYYSIIKEQVEKELKDKLNKD